MLDQTYHRLLSDALTGRRLPSGQCPEQGMFTLWGADAGIPQDDIHCDRLYQIALEWDENLVITGVSVAVTGELISPCSGYAAEPLDQFDYPPVLAWCLAHTLPG